MLCLHTWQGIWPVGVTELECPSCHSMRGRGKWDIAPPSGRLIWTCDCGETFLNILDDRVHCPGCGKQWPMEQFICK